MKRKNQIDETMIPEESACEPNAPEIATEEAVEDDSPKRKSFLNIHMILLLVLVLFVACIIYRITHWGHFIDQNDLVYEELPENLSPLDWMMPAVDEAYQIIPGVEHPTVLVFGNDPLADDRASEDNLANMIATLGDCTVYNCAVSGSYLASEHYAYDAETAPMDAYCFYWLIALATLDNNEHYYQQAAEVLGDDLPEGAKEAFDILTTIDLSEVDVLLIMYDATDYLMGHPAYDDGNSTNIQYFTGNLEAGIELFKFFYPQTRIIVMSPTYAFAVKEDGSYISSDMYFYNRDVLSTYVIKEGDSCVQRSVSFVDNIYGTFTEKNATEYLTDNLHLNVEGRKLVAERFVKALRYYDDK